MLGRCVGRNAGHPLFSGCRCDIHNPAISGLAHVRDHGLAAVENPIQVDGKNFVPGLVRIVPNRQHRAIDARVVDKAGDARCCGFAAGCDGVILIGQTCDPFSVEAVRASMGSLFAIAIAAATFEDFKQWTTANTVRIIAASMHGTHAHDKAKFGERSCILMGNEQSGLPADVETACDELVRIPMMGKADSLNLASAASVMIYEAWRANGYTGATR